MFSGPSLIDRPYSESRRMDEWMSKQHDDSDYLQTLLQLGATLNVSLDLTEVLDIAIQQVVKFVKAERGFILLVDESSHKVWGKVTLGIDGELLEAALSGKDTENRPLISRSIIDESLRRHRAVLSTNATEDPRFASHTSVQLSEIRSVLCVPLIAQGKGLGIIYLDNRIRSGVFSERHAEMLTAFANQAAVAIQNARLYDNLRKSAEDQLRLQNKLHANETRRLALEEAGRLRSEFIGIISHELRNPLTTIRGFVQTLAQDVGHTLPEETCAEFYATIEAEADRMLSLINDLLDASRLEAGKPITLVTRRVHLRPILDRLARSQRFTKFWQPNHKLELEVADDLPDLIADEDKIIQIATNLLSNAIKYSPNGGTITLRAVGIADAVVISVSDEGVGMTEEQRSSLFGRFERADREDIKAISGTGIGLYLTRSLVELHHGSIDCESVPGKGSTFTVTLPLTQPEAAPTTQAD